MFSDNGGPSASDNLRDAYNDNRKLREQNEAMARDLETARQERDAALLALSVARDVAHEYQQQGEKLEGEIAAAVRAARAETDERTAVLNLLLEHGSWYVSAIELDTRHVDGELLRDRLARAAREGQ